MSRSLVGSSSSSTLGSPISRRISCSRRRSPPERSRTSVRAALAAEAEAVAQHARGHLAPVAQRGAAARTSSSASSTRRWPGISAVSWERWARRTVAPRSTSPAAGSSSPASSLTSVVLPEPLTPTSATRSPGPSRQVAPAQEHPVAERDRDVHGVEHLVAQPRGREAQQLGAVARLRLVGDQRVGGLDAELRLRRARRRPAPQPRQLLAQQLRGAGPRARASSGRARRARARRPRSRPRTGGPRRRRPPRSRVQTASRNQRSWVTTSSEPRRAARWRASQSTPSTSRWLVGSSSSSSSGPSSSSRASAIRRRSPPDSGAIGVSSPSGKRAHPDAAEQPVEHGAERRVARPLVVGAPADELLADRPPRVELVALAEHRHAEAAGARDARRRRAPRRRRSAAAASTCRRRCARRRRSGRRPTTPERDVAQHRPAAVALVDGVEVDEVARRGHRARILPGSRR